MKPTSALRQYLITLALLTACSAAYAQVTVVTDPLKTYSDQGNHVRLVPTTAPSSDLNTSTTNWVGSSVTHTSDPASVRRSGATSTADSTASGVLSGTPLAATFTTQSWASVASDNRFSRPSSGTISATSDAWIHNVITFSVGQLSNYSWSATLTFLGTFEGYADIYFLLSDTSYNYSMLSDTSYNYIDGARGIGPSSGSGQLAAGDYILAWGGSVNSTSQETGTVGTLFGSEGFTQSGELTVIAAPVPEPETYAMMLAGLGLLGMMARRRKQKISA